MTPEQIALVEESLSALRPQMPAIAADFYRRLFAAEPSLEALFEREPADQQRTFARELDAIMSSIRDHDAFRTEAESLGARHRRYGVHPIDYTRAGTHLIAALGAALGERWTPALAEAWHLAYNLTVEVMIAGGTEDRPAASRRP